MSRRYKTPANRDQQSFLPDCIEDYVSEDNPIRVIEAFVESLDLSLHKFQYSEQRLSSGQPAYSPACLLKLYLYGYIYKIRSSRCLERETYRNIEVLWLMGKLQPTYKTIANFRKNNAQALQAVNRDFILLCKELNLFGAEIVGIDGSFFNGNASKASIYTKEKLNKQLRAIQKKIEQYQQQLDMQDQADDKSGHGSLVEDPDLSKKLQQLEEKLDKKKALASELQSSGEKQISTTDNDARLLRKRGQTTAGYNIQIAVDAKNKLIVSSEACNDGNDAHQLWVMATQAKAVLDVKELSAVADAGYYEKEQLKSCEDAEITTYVPIPQTRDLGRYSRELFSFDEQANAYICPQGEVLSQKGRPRKKENKMQLFYASNPKECAQCPKRDKCLSEGGHKRTLYRWEHEAVIERHKERMKDSGQWMRLRSALAEHPFGTLKRRSGWDHFLVRGLDKVSGELSLMTLCYNFTRVLNIIGAKELKRYCEQRSAQLPQ